MIYFKQSKSDFARLVTSLSRGVVPCLNFCCKGRRKLLKDISVFIAWNTPLVKFLRNYIPEQSVFCAKNKKKIHAGFPREDTLISLGRSVISSLDFITTVCKFSLTPRLQEVPLSLTPLSVNNPTARKKWPRDIRSPRNVKRTSSRGHLFIWRFSFRVTHDGLRLRGATRSLFDFRECCTLAIISLTKLASLVFASVSCQYCRNIFW